MRHERKNAAQNVDLFQTQTSLDRKKVKYPFSRNLIFIS